MEKRLSRALIRRVHDVSLGFAQREFGASVSQFETSWSYIQPLLTGNPNAKRHAFVEKPQVWDDRLSTFVEVLVTLVLKRDFEPDVARRVAVQRAEEAGHADISDWFADQIVQTISLFRVLAPVTPSISVASKTMNVTYATMWTNNQDTVSRVIKTAVSNKNDSWFLTKAQFSELKDGLKNVRLVIIDSDKQHSMGETVGDVYVDGDLKFEIRDSKNATKSRLTVRQYRILYRVLRYWNKREKRSITNIAMHCFHHQDVLKDSDGNESSTYRNMVMRLGDWLSKVGIDLQLRLVSKTVDVDPPQFLVVRVGECPKSSNGCCT